MKSAPEVTGKKLPNADVPLRALPPASYARAHGLGRTTVWMWIKAGKLKTTTVCGRKLVLLDQSEASA